MKKKMLLASSASLTEIHMFSVLTQGSSGFTGFLPKNLLEAALLLFSLVKQV